MNYEDAVYLAATRCSQLLKAGVAFHTAVYSASSVFQVAPHEVRKELSRRRAIRSESNGSKSGQLTLPLGD